MRANFGDKAMQELVKNDPTLRWTPDYSRPTRALRREDHLISKVGIGILQALETTYAAYKEKPNEATAKKYCTWRLRLHIKLSNNHALLEEINEVRGLGLYDEGPGPTCWDYDYD